MKLLKILSEFFNSKPREQKQMGKRPQRRYIKDVKAGEYINIEWYRFQGGVWKIKCVNNDPETRKIWLEINWTNAPKEHLILDYNDEKLKNFHLLNQVVQKTEESESNFDMATLQKNMNEALEKEEYEKADELQKKIDKLLRKK